MEYTKYLLQCNEFNENTSARVSKIVETKYLNFPWDGDGQGIIEQIPWVINDFIKTGNGDFYTCNEKADISPIVDDRCFEYFSCFLAMLRGNGGCIKHLLRVAPSNFTKSERLIPFLGYSTSAFKYLHESLRYDKNKLRNMLEVNGNILKYLTSIEYEHVVSIDRDLVVFCVVNGCKLHNIPSFIPFDREMAISVLQKMKELYVHQQSSRWHDLIDEMFKRFRNDLDVTCAMLKRDSFLSIHRCTQLLEDKDALLELVKFGPILNNVSKSVQNAHREIVVI
ncbi:hypothetical protein FDP41_013737 [Naegleria fowleri]|uniref:Uncharacterized protein n=1 Tax=Naegleria fowleri TaxID=5763 RepID=A0A6A5BR42_NAEFO|nr:uncharacterized protein FDP41_013737 [Naegleria fowleri]KAF0980523.1 hypothetical protein FDP41_013737 [Naegleria fowleri]